MNESDGGPGHGAGPDPLIEQVTGAWRPTDPRTRGPRAHPAFFDLDAFSRERAHRETLRLRAMEAALDPEGLSTTSRAVLARIRRDR